MDRECNKNEEPDVTAPYRFVLPHTEIVLAEEAVSKPDINTPLKQGYCATIRVKWCAEMPLLIGGVKESESDKTVRPVRLGDTYVLPGSSLKGMLRSAMEITTCARTTIYGYRGEPKWVKKHNHNRGAETLQEFKERKDKKIKESFENIDRMLKNDNHHYDVFSKNFSPDMVQALFGYVEEEDTEVVLLCWTGLRQY